ncbi:hypothetical protein FRC10_002901, partial [Ceratobasidium sp. 414]
AGTVEEVYLHCLEECPNLDHFKTIYDACVWEPDPVSKMVGTQAWKHVWQLYDGITMHFLDSLEQLSDWEILGLGQSTQVIVLSLQWLQANSHEKHKYTHMPSCLTITREMVALGEGSRQGGKVVDKHAAELLAKVVKEYLTKEDKAWMDEQLGEIELDKELDFEVNLTAHLSHSKSEHDEAP